MEDEISAAVMFLTRLIGKSEKIEGQMENFRCCLRDILIRRFKNHWFPEKPFKGQAYRCIRVNETNRRDPILQAAAEKCGLKYEDLKLPIEFTLWVDPHEVCCRFGEHKGSYCTVASFKNGNKENFVDKINIEELEKKTVKIIKQAVEEGSKREINLKEDSTSPQKYNFSPNYQSRQNVLQQLPTLSPKQNFQMSVYSNTSSSYRRSPSSSSQHLAFGNIPPTQGTQANAFYSRGMHHYSNANLSYPRYPQKYIRNSNSYHGGPNNIASRISTSVHLNSKNDRYHWVK